MNRPRASRELVRAAAYLEWHKAHPGEALPTMFVVGVRGYYRDTMGAAGQNDRGIYDDGIFVLGPETFAAFNGNTDPSVNRKGIASLRTGVHPYKMGNHGITRPGGGYPAFRPATRNEELPVTRDGTELPWPGVAINIHRGGRTSTSSAGCQTIPPAQWDAFYALTVKELKAARMKSFPYILIEGPIV